MGKEDSPLAADQDDLELVLTGDDDVRDGQARADDGAGLPLSLHEQRKQPVGVYLKLSGEILGDFFENLLRFQRGFEIQDLRLPDQPVETVLHDLVALHEDLAKLIPEGVAGHLLGGDPLHHVHQSRLAADPASDIGPIPGISQKDETAGDDQWGRAHREDHESVKDNTAQLQPWTEGRPEAGPIIGDLAGPHDDQGDVHEHE
jgi:hypothetical protein